MQVVDGASRLVGFDGMTETGFVSLLDMAGACRGHSRQSVESGSVQGKSLFRKVFGQSRLFHRMR